MPSVQQPQIPSYKETANIPRPNTAYRLHDERRSDGAALARLLGVTSSKLGPVVKANIDKQEAQQNEVDTAHAQLGLERINRDNAGGTLDLVTGDFDPDAYKMKQGQLAAAKASGVLRDKYLSEGVNQFKDPEEFNKWLHASIAEDLASAKEQGPSFYTAFVKELGDNVELMSKQFAGHAAEVISRDSATAFKEKLKIAREADKYSSNASELGDWLKSFLVSESGGNWNAWFGNAGSKEDLSGLTLREILKRQDQPGNDAAGLIQIVPGTLRHVIRKYGFSKETKFTPQVQTEIALLLMKEQGMDKWLKGRMTDGQFADRLATVWAGLKTSKGRGVYDGDGINAGTQNHGVTVKQLGTLKALLSRNTGLLKVLTRPDTPAGTIAKWIESEGWSLGGTASASKRGAAHLTKLLNDEVGTGVSQKEARDIHTSSLKDALLNDPEAAPSEDEVEREIKVAKLNKEQAAEVRAAAATRRQQDEVVSQEALRKQVADTVTAVSSGDIQSIKESAPKHFAAVVERMTIPEDASMQEASAVYITEADLSDKELPSKALREYLEGKLTKDDFTELVKQHEIAKTSTQLLRNPGVADVVESVKNSLNNPVLSKTFDRLLKAALADLIETKEGKRPPTLEILQTVEQVAQIAASKAESDTSSILEKYKL